MNIVFVLDSCWSAVSETDLGDQPVLQTKKNNKKLG